MTEKCFDRGSYTLCIDKVTKQQRKIPKDGPKPVKLGTVAKAVNFAKAATKHVATGRKIVSLEVIQDRFETCRNCKLFGELDRDGIPAKLKDIEVVGTCLHVKCNCYLHDQKVFPNKLSWASQSCPEGYWGAE